VFLSLTLLDGQQQRLETLTSEKIRQTDGWERLRLGPVSMDRPEARLALLGLHVEPGDRADLTGTVCFDDVRLSRRPRVTLTADDPLRLYVNPNAVAVTCRVSGFDDPEAAVAFSLEDPAGRLLAESREPLGDFQTPEQGEGSRPVFASREPGQAPGQAVWRPPVPGLGFYRVRAQLMGHKGPLSERVAIGVTVIDPRPTLPAPEFGWTVPRGTETLSLDTLIALIEASAVGRVKYPLWLDPEDAAGADEAIRLSRELPDRGIQLVGLLGNPPFEVPNRYDPDAPPTVAEVFQAPPELWGPSLEKVMVRMHTRIQRWQLGRDGDTSLAGYPRLAEKIAQIKAELDRVAYDFHVGLAWDWSAGPPPESSGALPWRFVSVAPDPTLGPDQLGQVLSDTARRGTERWVSLAPLDASHATEERAADLVRRIVAAKEHGADAIFVPSPFSTDHGLLDADAAPGELWLPWRTTATLLSGTAPAGSLQLPGGSENRLFVRDNDTVMVFWSAGVAEERIWLGPNAREMDVWGRVRELSPEGPRPGIEAGPVPRFVVGVEAALPDGDKALSWPTRGCRACWENRTGPSCGSPTGSIERPGGC